MQKLQDLTDPDTENDYKLMLKCHGLFGIAGS